MLHIYASVASSQGDSPLDAELAVVDLDTISDLEPERYRRIVGFTGSFEATAVELHRVCSVILHRPFEMRVFREELLSYFPLEAAIVPATSPSLPILRLEGQSLRIGEFLLPLTATEQKIMAYLFANRGMTVSREALAEKIGGGQNNKTDVYICYLRKKMQPYSEKNWIRTIRGEGYCLVFS